MLLWKANGRMLMFYHTEKEKQTGLRRGKRSGISTQEKIPQWGKCTQQQQEDARPGEADLGNLSEQQLSLWSSVELGKEVNPSRHTRVPFYTCSPKLWEGHIEPRTLGGLDWIQVVPPEEVTGDPHPHWDQKGHQDTAGTHVVVTIFLPNSALSPFPLLSSSPTFTFNIHIYC